MTPSTGREPQKVHQNLQADVWESEAEILLDHIGVERGWSCADLACGATGILAILARRVGAEGLVVGADTREELAREAQSSARAAGQNQVRAVVTDLLQPALADSSFDLVHLRFALHLIDPESAIACMTRLAKPGGWVAIQEPDLASWRYEPEIPAWPHLLAVLTAAISLSGDPNVGRLAPGLMIRAGLKSVDVRPAALHLSDQHPHMRLPLAWYAALKETILANRLAGESDLEGWVGALEAHLLRPEVSMVTPTTLQAWGRRPS